MQLSASTTPTDSNHAAFGPPARRPAAGEAALRDTGSPAGDPSAFDDMLAGAAAPTAAGGPAPAAQLDGASLAGPAVAATQANFPSWLVSAVPSAAPSPEIISPAAPADATGAALHADGTKILPKAAADPLFASDATAATSVSPDQVVRPAKPSARRSAAGQMRGAKVAAGDVPLPTTAAPTAATATVEAAVAAVVDPTGAALLPQPAAADAQQPTADESGTTNKNFTTLPASPARTAALVARVAMPVVDLPLDRLKDFPGPVPAQAKPGAAPSSELPVQNSSNAQAAPLPTVSDAAVPLASPPAARLETLSPTPAEIFAAAEGKMTVEKKSAPDTSQKKFLNPMGKRVVAHGPDFGIGVAKSESAMPTATFTNRASPVTPLGRVPDAPVVTALATPMPVPPEEPMLIAYRAVDAVLTAVERFGAGDRQAVQLHFSVGGSDLAVRVELRGDEVRTTFRTDSPELRTVLAHEWQVATAGATDRPLRLTPPVFSSHDPAGFSAFAGDTSSGQRHARARPEADEFYSSGPSRSAPVFAAAVDDLMAGAARGSVPGTARHLSTLA